MPWVEILVSVISASATLLAVVLKNYYTKSKSHNIEKRIKRDVVLYKILTDIRKKFNFSRVAVAQFHNGNKYYTGEPIQKFSISFETSSPGIPQLSSSMKDIPLGTITYVLSNVSANGFFCVENLSKCGNDNFANLMRAYDEQAYYVFKIEDDSGWVGMLIADYCKVSEPLTPVSCEWLRVQASRIATLLTLSNQTYEVE